MGYSVAISSAVTAQHSFNSYQRGPAMLWHQADPHSFRGTHTHGGSVLAPEKLLAFLLNEIDLDIRTVGVMVVHHQASGLGIDRQLPCLGYSGMAPAKFMRHICLEILRVMNQHIGTAAKFDPLIIAGSVACRRFQFIIRDIDTGHPILLHTISKPATRVVDVCAPDIEIIPGQHPFKVIRDAFGIRWQLTCEQREICTVNLVKQGTDLTVLFRAAGEHANAPARLVDWREIRIALNVVPVTMGQQDSYLIVAVLETLAKFPYTRTRVQNQALPVIQLDIYAGSVPAVFCSSRPRGRDRATDTVEGYYQLTSSGNERQSAEYGSDTDLAQVCPGIRYPNNTPVECSEDPNRERNLAWLFNADLSSLGARSGTWRYNDCFCTGYWNRYNRTDQYGSWGWKSPRVILDISVGSAHLA